MECWVVSCVVSNLGGEDAVYLFSAIFCFGSEDESSNLLRNIAKRIQNHSTSLPEYRANNFHRRVNLQFDTITERGHYVKPVLASDRLVWLHSKDTCQKYLHAAVSWKIARTQIDQMQHVCNISDQVDPGSDKPVPETV